MKVLIVGGSKGLGKYLASNVHNAETYMIARSEQSDERISNFCIDVNPEKKPDYSCFDNIKFDIVVYLVSMWGESSSLKTDELVDFMNVGPLGYLNLVNELHSQESLGEKCSIVSIGSTAEMPDGTRYPAYSLSKKLLKDISCQLQNIHQSYRFTHFTIGSIGQREEERIEYSSILEIINTLSKMDSNTYLSSMVIKSKLDM
ncbi:hypothetical protein CS022_13930 [Veronia nyctiphanis]|uniref:Uncharacterized protein n=1 Tax=Veronia nyctiphanis TaxID=1278244 RepID=A0A4Q0YP07_9GAMM|nr:hypothetical protein [Veronia nyctiphanis]RXJ72730.1 hypothetical protein CS022_13930 [Veronia nyctiphanis]